MTLSTEFQADFPSRSGSFGLRKIVGEDLRIQLTETPERYEIQAKKSNRSVAHIHAYSDDRFVVLMCPTPAVPVAYAVGEASTFVAALDTLRSAVEFEMNKDHPAFEPGLMLR